MERFLGEGFILLQQNLAGREDDMLLDQQPPAPRTRAGAFFSLHTLAEDALAVVQKLGWTEFHVVGLSMGGMVAQVGGHKAWHHEPQHRSNYSRCRSCRTTPGLLTDKMMVHGNPSCE